MLVLAIVTASVMAAGHADDHETTFGVSRPELVSTPGDPRTFAAQLNDALANGDADTVRALLQEDVLIYESRGVETSAAQYFEQHFSADVAFLSKLKRERHLRRSTISRVNAAPVWQ